MKNIKTTNISNEEINKICKIKINKIEGIVEDKVSVVEKPYSELVPLYRS